LPQHPTLLVGFILVIGVRETMKIAVLVACLFPIADAIKCGRPFTSACLGDTDKRYDPDASNSAVDQAVVWSKFNGYFRGEGVSYVNILDPLVAPIPTTSDPNVGSLPYVDYANYSIIGSRQIISSITISPIAPRVIQLAVFGTTTYEKDGSVLTLPGAASPPDDVPSREELFGATASDAQRSYAVNDNTIYIGGRSVGENPGINSITYACLDDECNQFQENLDSFVTTANGTVKRVYASEAFYTRIATREEWIDAVLNEYEVQGINASERIDPLVDVCSIGRCPTEEQWCQTDPNCSVSPYQEPPATVKGSVIAGFTVAGVVLLVIILYGVHLYLVYAQVNRYRARFARRIAETIDVRASVRNLTPDALAREFERIDEGVSKDGKISKEELWEFIASGKAGEMDQKDFDALFAAIDLDRNGEVDFVEFCAFLGQCDNEYRAARRRSSVGLQQQRSMVASRLSETVSQRRTVEDPSAIPTGEGDDEKEEGV